MAHPTVAEFDFWHSTLGLKHISASELRAKTQRKENHIPDHQLWGNIVLAAHLVDRLRAHFRRPVTLHSTFRSPEYNRSVGGVRDSQHLDFRAIDFSIAGIKPATVAAKLRSWRDQGLFAGGIGVYPSFVHIDTRGVNADW